MTNEEIYNEMVEVAVLCRKNIELLKTDKIFSKVWLQFIRENANELLSLCNKFTKE